MQLRRTLLARLAGFVAATISLAALPLAHAQSPAPANYPDRPIRLVVGVPAGGTIDLIARIIGQQLSKQMGQSVIVENKGGAGGNIGANFVAKAAPDGYTLFVSVIGTMAINPSLYKSLPFDPVKDFASISQLSSVPQLMVINKNVPANTLAEFITYAKANPGKLNYASGGSGTATHLAGELFNAVAGTDLVHVPYKGSAPAMTDLISGQAAAMFDQISTALPQVRNGTVRAMGVTTKQRSPVAPDIPSLAEGGLTGYDMSTWHGLVAPAGTPVAIINYLHDQTVKALESPEVRKSFADAGIVPVSSTPAELEKFTADEIVRWREVIRKAGIEPVQ